MKQKKQKGAFLSMLLGTLGSSLLANLLAGKRARTTGQGGTTIREDEEIIRAGQGF